MADPVTLAIVGSTRFAHPSDWFTCDSVIRDSIAQLQPALVVSGGAQGIDTLGVCIARELGVPYREFLPRVRRWAGPGGFKERNTSIAQACTHLLRVYCSASTTYGSGWTADLAQRLGADVRRYCPCTPGTAPFFPEWGTA